MERSKSIFSVALFWLSLTVHPGHAASVYTPYTFTTFAGSASVPGGHIDAAGSNARFNTPFGVAVDNFGNVFVADTSNRVIRKITPDGLVSTFAGAAGISGSTDGTGGEARFANPVGIAVDSAGNVYVADDYSGTIRKITAGGVVTTLAGTAGKFGSTDGDRNSALFNYPTGVAVDGAGVVFVADGSNHTIRKITPDGFVTTLAGNASITNQLGYPLGGYADGANGEARFNGPNALALDRSGNLFVSDTMNNAIRKVTPNGTVTTLAGLPQFEWQYGRLVPVGGSDDGVGSAARFNIPSGVAVDRSGNIFVVDCYNDTIRRVTPGGEVTTVAGLALTPGNTDGLGNNARFGGAFSFYGPTSVAVDIVGNLYVADTWNNAIRRGSPLLQFEVGFGSLNVSNGIFRSALTGLAGTRLLLEKSQDLKTWTPIQTNTLEGNRWQIQLPIEAKQFFRSRLAPN